MIILKNDPSTIYWVRMKNLCAQLLRTECLFTIFPLCVAVIQCKNFESSLPFTLDFSRECQIESNPVRFQSWTYDAIHFIAITRGEYQMSLFARSRILFFYIVVMYWIYKVPIKNKMIPSHARIPSSFLFF